MKIRLLVLVGLAISFTVSAFAQEKRKNARGKLHTKDDRYAAVPRERYNCLRAIAESPDSKQKLSGQFFVRPILRSESKLARIRRSRTRSVIAVLI
jgi:hypothetical protein